MGANETRLFFALNIGSVGSLCTLVLFLVKQDFLLVFLLGFSSGFSSLLFRLPAESIAENRWASQISEFFETGTRRAGLFLKALIGRELRAPSAIGRENELDLEHDAHWSKCKYNLELRRFS